VLEPAAPLDVAPGAPAVAAPAVPLLLGVLTGFVVVALDPPAGGFVAAVPAVAREPAAASGVDGPVAAEPLEPVAAVCVSSGVLEQAVRHSESSAELASILRAMVE
jgi:hypothetical protein